MKPTWTGSNLAYAVTPETFTDFVDLLAPELQRFVGLGQQELRPMGEYFYENEPVNAVAQKMADWWGRPYR